MATSKRVTLRVMHGGKQTPDTVTSAVAGEVRAALARRRVPQAEVAEALGVTPMWLSRRLSGNVPFTVEQLVAVAQLIECNPAELMPPPNSYGDPVLHIRKTSVRRRSSEAPFSTRWSRYPGAMAHFLALPVSA